MAFQGVDFFNIDDLFSQEEKLVRESVRSFVEEKVLPIIEEHYMKGTFPSELVKTMADLGYLGANLKGYGCAGLNHVAYGLMMQELERGDSGLRSFASVQGALVMYPISAFGSDEQRERWLPKLQSGAAIGCFGLTEPDFGSNPSGLRTRAVKDGDEYILNGTKAWITNGSIADIAVLWARCEDECIRGFLVEKGTKGFTSKDYHNKHSLRASVTSELIFDDCRIPESNLLPETDGLKNALMCLNQARYGIAWGAIGSAMACYDTARRWSLERRQFAGKPIASHQLVQNKLVHMLTGITKAQLLAHRLGQLKEAGQLRYDQISMAKRNNVAMALEVARMARDILGANGILSDYPVFRHMANLETVYTYEGTHDIHALILGQSITGISAFE
ncbi:acyl-CoA dehydrogenase family protein [Acidobacteria bacterium AH-259-D05]|nr:acyl-CoA dehydrogenase family protein [Acidobacteria bacterium AH-259-D05]